MTGQSTVTATIAAYAGGTVMAIFNAHGGGTTTRPQVSGNIDASGTFSLAAWDNTNARYKPSTTTFIIRAENGITSFATTVTVTGTSQDISSSFTDAPIPGGGGTGGGVNSVFSRTGDVVAQTGDYSASQISGLGSAATVDIGMTGSTIPLLSLGNTWAGIQRFIPGIATNAINNLTSGNNASIGLPLTGATISRFITDANAALTVTQKSVLSTGDIVDFCNNTGVVASVSQSGAFIAPSLLSNTSLTIGTANLNTLVLQTNGTTRWSVAAAPGNLIPATNGGQTIGDATHQVQNIFSGNVVSSIGAPVASAATIAPTGSIFHITGTVPISTITPPPGFDATHGGSIQFIADAVFPIASGGNIATPIAATVAGTLYIGTWDGTSWYIK